MRRDTFIIAGLTQLVVLQQVYIIFTLRNG